MVPPSGALSGAPARLRHIEQLFAKVPPGPRVTVTFVTEQGFARRTLRAYEARSATSTGSGTSGRGTSGVRASVEATTTSPTPANGGGPWRPGGRLASGRAAT